MLSIAPEVERRISMEEIKKTLRLEHACYVLITCGSPTTKGEMNVEMSYEGDDLLASYLVNNAQEIFDDRLSIAPKR